MINGSASVSVVGMHRVALSGVVMGDTVQSGKTLAIARDLMAKAPTILDSIEALEPAAHLDKAIRMLDEGCRPNVHRPR